MRPLTPTHTPRLSTPASPGRAGFALCLAALCTLAGCGSVRDRLPSADGITPYKIDVVQGNVVTSEQLKALQPGMPRAQVRDVLGSPLLMSVFHNDRWDYVFTYRRQGQDKQQRKVTVLFKGDAMDRVQADELPSETEFVSSLDVRRSLSKPPPLEASEAQLKAFKNSNKSPAPTPEGAATAAPSTNYPPLEEPAAAR